MRNSEQWWQEVKSDPEKLHEWLRKQYYGEVTAASRIRYMARGANLMDQRVLNVIAKQEETHAEWVRELLRAREITDPEKHDGAKKYWAQVAIAAHDFPTMAAIGHLAEGMRLERIRVIARDVDAPADIRNVFIKILRDEEFHEEAFGNMTTPEAIEMVRPHHSLGRTVLGLEA